MRRFLPVLVLLLLSPFIAEIIFGATPVSNFASLPLIILIYGGGAVLIRELARRRGAGWGRIALLGAAYAIIEEGLALQSLFDPALFNAGDYGGRWLGVNWVWSEWTIGYHILWSISLPILLAELVFPGRRRDPWLGKIGLTITAGLYLLSVTALGVFSHRFIDPGFQTPLPLALGAAIVAGGLVVLALAWPVPPSAAPEQPPTTGDSHPAPSPQWVGLAALAVSGAWFGLLGLPQALRHGPQVLVPMLGELALAAGFVLLLRSWSVERGWADPHRLALGVGPLLVVMAVGFFAITAGNRVNQMGQGIASGIGMGLLALLAQRVRQRAGSAPASPEVVLRHPRPHA